MLRCGSDRRPRVRSIADLDLQLCMKTIHVSLRSSPTSPIHEHIGTYSISGTRDRYAYS